MKHKIKINNSIGQVYYISKFKIQTDYSFNYKELEYIQYKLEGIIQELKIMNKQNEEYKKRIKEINNESK